MKIVLVRTQGILLKGRLKGKLTAFTIVVLIMCGPGDCVSAPLLCSQAFPLNTLRLSTSNTYSLCPMPTLTQTIISTRVGFSSNLLFLKQIRACCIPPVRPICWVLSVARLKSVLYGQALKAPSTEGPSLRHWISRSQLKCRPTAPYK